MIDRPPALKCFKVKTTFSYWEHWSEAVPSCSSSLLVFLHICLQFFFQWSLSAAFHFVKRKSIKSEATGGRCRRVCGCLGGGCELRHKPAEVHDDYRLHYRETPPHLPLRAHLTSSRGGGPSKETCIYSQRAPPLQITWLLLRSVCKKNLKSNWAETTAEAEQRFIFSTDHQAPRKPGA